MHSSRRLPAWFRQPVPCAERISVLKSSLEKLAIHTVCQSAHCPNLGRCWKKNTATFMILGDTCTRSCRFCAVPSGIPGSLNLDEPIAVAKAVKKLGFDYVVVTSVTREDLEDQGCQHFAQTIKHVRALNPGIKVEVLIPDFLGKKDLIETVVRAFPEVIAHNIETVRRLTPALRPRADYERSLSVLKTVKEANPNIFVKSGIMVGLGETLDEIEETMQDLYLAGCDILTIGQYLAPSTTARHVPVARFVSPEEFEQYKEKALAIGMKYVFSSPLVRSSYLAKEAYQSCLESQTMSVLEKVS